GGMGALFAGLFRDEGLGVRITGPDEEKGRRVAGELGVEYMQDNREAAGDADIVMISVPIGKTLDVIKEVAPSVKKEALLMDVTSVKKAPCDAMLRYSGAGVEVMGTHPVFGPRVGIEGQVFFLTPVRAGKWLPWMRKFLKKYDAVVYESTPDEHDRLMAVVQGLTHFVFISVGRTLQRLDFDLRESRKVSSPVYDLMLDIVGRIVGQNPDVYASIQMGNPEILEIHRAFLETGQEISDTVGRGDKEGFIGMVNEIARHFHNLDDAIKRSDRQIHSMVSDLNYLRNSVGDEVLLKHIYSGGMHLGVVREVSPQEVVIDESGKLHHLKLSNIEIQGSDEMRQYRKKKFGVVR
ncbi:MAG: prephenate dehydrogenase/arogenate dehydrogenase family protein, partial [Candidatus Altiarchaeales archaeon]|nr:prephenate dehydrogenase/arogenate dehydrogenase family protein [Candidatus Altiarchaeales archaeon]